MNIEQLNKGLEAILGERKVSQKEMDAYRAAYAVVNDAYSHIGLMANVEGKNEKAIQKGRARILDQAIEKAFDKYSKEFRLTSKWGAKRKAKKLAREMWSSIQPEKYVDVVRMSKEERLADLSPKLQDAFTSYANKHNPILQPKGVKKQYSKKWGHGLAYGLGFGILLGGFGVWCQPSTPQPQTRDRTPISESARPGTAAPRARPAMGKTTTVNKKGDMGFEPNVRLDASITRDTIDYGSNQTPKLTDDGSDLEGAGSKDASGMSVNRDLEDILGSPAQANSKKKSVYEQLSPANQKRYNAKKAELKAEALTGSVGQELHLQGYAENLLRQQKAKPKESKPKVKTLTPLQKEFNRIKAYKKSLLEGKVRIGRANQFTLQKDHVTHHDVILAYSTNFGTERWNLFKGYQRFKKAAEAAGKAKYWNLDQHGLPFGPDARSKRVDETNLFGPNGQATQSALLAYVQSKKKDSLAPSTIAKPVKPNVRELPEYRKFNPKPPAPEVKVPKPSDMTVPNQSGRSLRHEDLRKDSRVSSRMPPHRTSVVGVNKPGETTKGAGKKRPVLSVLKKTAFTPSEASVVRTYMKDTHEKLLKDYKSIRRRTEYVIGTGDFAGQSLLDQVYENCGVKPEGNSFRRTKPRTSRLEIICSAAIKNANMETNSLMRDITVLGKEALSYMKLRQKLKRHNIAAPELNLGPMPNTVRLRQTIKDNKRKIREVKSTALSDSMTTTQVDDLYDKSVVEDYVSTAHRKMRVADVEARYGGKAAVDEVLGQYGGRSGVMQAYRTERRENVYKDHAEGMAVKDIAEKYGVSASTVRRDMKKFQTKSPIEAIMADSGITEADLEKTTAEYSDAKGKRMAEQGKVLLAEYGVNV